MTDAGKWLPEGFVPPERLELSTGAHLRPLRADDVDLDYAAVMSSRMRLWELFGDAWGWPRETMTKEQDRADLERHEAEMRRNVSFAYAIFDAGEDRLLGCLYVDPPRGEGADADVIWWVIDEMVGTSLDTALTEEIPSWVRDRWPFARARIVGVDLPWAAWVALPPPEA